MSPRQKEATGDGGPVFDTGVGRVAAPLRERVLDLVREAILDFKLKPGQRLVERELIEQLEVSRTTVRDVLARLASEGLVTIIPQKGAIVTVLSLDEAADIYEMRASLEGLAVRRFIERSTPEQMAELRETLGEIERAAKSGMTPSDGLRAKDHFYEVLLAGAHSPRLDKILTSLQGQVHLLRATSLSVRGRPKKAAAEIRRIVKAIEAGDAEAGAVASATHVRHAAEAGLARLNDRLESQDQAAGDTLLRGVVLE